MKFDIAKRTIQLRNLAGYERKDLAIVSGVPEATIWRIENYKHNATLEIIEKLCNGFGITLSDFFLASEISVKNNPKIDNEKLPQAHYNPIEYKKIAVSEEQDIENELNKHGSNGWEIAGMVDKGVCLLFILMRKRNNEI